MCQNRRNQTEEVVGMPGGRQLYQLATALVQAGKREKARVKPQTGQQKARGAAPVLGCLPAGGPSRFHGAAGSASGQSHLEMTALHYNFSLPWSSSKTVSILKKRSISFLR